MRIIPELSWSFILEGLPFSQDSAIDVVRAVHETPPRSADPGRAQVDRT